MIIAFLEMYNKIYSLSKDMYTLDSDIVPKCIGRYIPSQGSAYTASPLQCDKLKCDPIRLREKREK